MYHRPVKSAPKVQERFAAPIKQLIEADPSFGYRTVAGLLRFNKNTVKRIFQIKGWQVRKRGVGHRPSHARTARPAALEGRPGDDGHATRGVVLLDEFLRVPLLFKAPDFAETDITRVLG